MNIEFISTAVVMNMFHGRSVPTPCSTMIRYTNLNLTSGHMNIISGCILQISVYTTHKNLSV